LTVTEQQDIFIYGASGHAKVIMDIVERQKTLRIAAVFDDNVTLHGQAFFGYLISGGRETLLQLDQQKRIDAGIIAIGDNGVRASLAAWLAQNGIKRVAATHPSAQIGRETQIGAGSVVMAGVVINSSTMIGEDAIINTGATVDHDCTIGDSVHIAPGCHLCGNVTVGNGSFIGAGSTVIPGIRIGAKVLIGAGSTVLRDLPDGARVAGSPCREITS
jgi:sugar O-acyltransferase (sialic acid O-acetyltransferase NeuD family)